MADKLSLEQRSALMGRIRGKDTKVELMVRRYLHRQGFRFRIHDRRLPGSPDIVLPKYRTVVFVHGCFWHGHEVCGLYRKPRTNTEFWEQKVLANRVRDQRNQEELEKRGWRVIIVWECELRTRSVREATLVGLVNELWEVAFSSTTN